jgi:putative FmdB family regulatory protein
MLTIVGRTIHATANILNMPIYDYRCQQCGRKFDLFYKSFKDYGAASGQHCPHCGSDRVGRSIRRVAIAKPGRDLSSLGSGEMLSVLDGGNSQEVGRLFQQVADTTGSDMGADFTEAARRLSRGDSIERVERDLADSSSATGAGEAASSDP